MAHFQVQQYSVVLLHDRAHVYLFESDVITAETRRVVLRFEPTGTSAVEDDGNMVTAYMDPGMVDRVIDLLRNEDPVFVVWWPTYLYLYARLEPVGEGEPTGI